MRVLDAALRHMTTTKSRLFRMLGTGRLRHSWLIRSAA